MSTQFNDPSGMTTKAMDPDFIRGVFHDLRSKYKFLGNDNTNVTLVEVGRFLGSTTRIMSEVWPHSAIFSLESAVEFRTYERYEEYGRSMVDMSTLPNVTAIQATSPMKYAWPREWRYDMLLMDIGSSYFNIGPSLTYWRQHAKAYPSMGHGIMAVLLPTGSELKKFHAQEYLEHTDLVVEHKYGSVHILR